MDKLYSASTLLQPKKGIQPSNDYIRYNRAKSKDKLISNRRFHL